MEKSYKRFTVEEILECKTNVEKMNELIENCQAMVNQISRKIYLDKIYDHEDKVQVASMGIIQSVHNFNVDMGVDFYTYCYKNVRNTLLREVQKTQTLGRGGRGRKFDYSTLSENESSKVIQITSIDKIIENPQESKLNSLLGDFSDSTSPHVLYVARNEEWDFLSKELKIPQAKLDIFIDYYLNSKSQAQIATEKKVSRQRINNVITEIEKKIREQYTVGELVARLY